MTKIKRYCLASCKVNCLASCNYKGVLYTVCFNSNTPYNQIAVFLFAAANKCLKKKSDFFSNKT